MNKAEKVSVVLVAGGRGERLGNINKASLELEGKPALSWLMEVFYPLADEIVLVLAPCYLDWGREFASRVGWPRLSVVEGGIRRQDSVAKGLAGIKETTWVIIHDAARPLVSKDLALSVLETAMETGAAIAATPVSDTIKTVSGGFVENTLPRHLLWAAQTPQVFRFEMITEAYRHLGEGEFTDDASLVERLGYRVRICPGSPENIKITFPQDIDLARMIISRRRARV